VNPPGESIEPLLLRLREGADREESFRLLFDRFYRPLFRFFERRGFSSQECQDLVQETFLRIYQGLGGFRGEARWEHWIFRIAANTASKALRHRGAVKRASHSVPLEEEDVADSPRASDGTPAPLRRLLGREMKERLIQGIDGLPAQMRRCVRLRVIQDLDYDEIAAILQLSPSTVKVQLFKARKRLRAELGDPFANLDL